MSTIDRLKKMDWQPRSRDVDKTELKSLLFNNKRDVLFCWHNWVYWTYGIAPKQHRVCRKCYKKQVDRNVIPKYSPIWVEDKHYINEPSIIKKI